MANPFSLEGKVILVTGASSGIGRQCAIQCSRMGAQIILSGRNEERLSDTLRELAGKGHRFFICDLSEQESVDGLVSELPSLDGVVHSAGINKRSPLKFIKQSVLEEVMNTNFLAPALFTQKLYKKKLLKTEASVVFISSVSAYYASLGNISYMASKGALNAYMRGVALEFAANGIRANAIQPGMIRTPLTASYSDEDIQKDLCRYPLKRFGTPEDIAYGAVYLLSDATKWMTGSVLTIDGGLTLR